MAEELKNRLLFKNPASQKQILWKLFNEVLEKKKAQSGQPFTGTSNEPPELQIFWDCCTSESRIVSTTSAECLVSMVFHKHATFNYVMKKMISTVQIAKNSCAVIQAITDLLLIEIQWSEENNEKYCCSYSLRNPPHPYISVLTSSPSMSSLLMEQVRQLLNIGKTRCDPCAVLRMLEPFFKFVLLNDGTDQHLSITLHSDILAAAGEQDGNDSKKYKMFQNYVTRFLVSLVDKHGLGHTVFFVKQLTLWLLWKHKEKISCDHWDTYMSLMVHHSVSLCWHLLHSGHDMTSTLDLLIKVKRTNALVFSDPTIIAAMSSLLLESPSRYQGKILELCLSILQSAEEDDNILRTISMKTSGCFLLLPALQILACPGSKSWTATQNSETLQEVALQLFTFCESISFQEYSEISDKEIQSCSQWNIPLSSWMRVTRNTVQMLQTFIWDERALTNWLRSLRSSLPKQAIVSPHVLMLLSVLLLKSRDTVAETILEVLNIIPKIDPHQSPLLMPLLLYKLGAEITSTLRLQILYSLPRLATHRMAVGPVLRIIQTIGLSPSLRPMAIRLFCKLWCEQSRVFPYLQRMLVAADEDIKGREAITELNIAKAATIKDICSTRPSQHGTDLVAYLSKFLTENCTRKAVKNDTTCAIVTFALDALQSLCQHQVVDFHTAWKVLSTTLIADERPQVIASVCRLLGLVPQLASVSEEYECFKEEALLYIWKCTQHKNPIVIGAAYSSLACFALQDLKLKHLPQQIQNPFKQKFFSKVKLEISEREEEDEDEKQRAFDNLICPGAALVQLLESCDCSSFPEFQRLLTIVIREEVSSLPRGLAYNITRRNQPNFRHLNSVPSSLLSQYEKSKTPGVNQGLAAGLLFCYDPASENRPGNTKRTQLLGYGRSYRGMLDSLLHEVPVQPSEWHRNMLVTQAWSSFMNRLYNTCLEGRIAELEMQHKRGHIKEPEELENKKNCAWLWLRDELTNQLKSASKGNPSVQANSVLGLAGLARTVASYMARLPDSSGTCGTASSFHEQRYQSCTEWLTLVTDTLMVILDGNCKVKGPTLQWCQQASSAKSSASSLLSRAYAALSLSQLVPVLVTQDMGRIKEIICLLREKLPGQAKCGSSAVIQCHCSLAVGLVLSKLYQDHFSDLAGREGYLLMATTLDLLESLALSTDKENTEGAILGVGLALVALCKEGLMDSRVHATTMHQKLKTLLMNHENDPGIKMQFLCMAVSSLTVSAFQAGLLSASVVSECVVLLHQLLQRHPQTNGVSLSFGLLVHGLAKAGHPEVPELASHQANVWKNSLFEQHVPMLERLSAANGLLALFGSEHSFIQVESDNAPIDVVKENLGEVVKYLLKIVSVAKDVGLATNVAWMLGHFHHAVISNPITQTGVPQSYSYLPDSSVLRSLFDLLYTARNEAFSESRSATINVVLESLISGPKTLLPPVNWAAVLGPLMRSSLGEKTRELCLRFAVSHARSSSSLPSFMSSWLKSAPFSDLSTPCKREIIRSLGMIVTFVPLARTQEFFEGVVPSLFMSHQGEHLQDDLIYGLISVLELSDPPPSVFPNACSTVEALYNIACTNINESGKQMNSLIKCLARLPRDRLEILLENTKSNSAVAAKVIPSLVGQGIIPLRWLSVLLGHMIRGTDCSKHIALQVVSAVNDSNNHLQRLDEQTQWFLEITSQLTDMVSSLSHNNQTLVTCFLVVVSGTALWWADVSFASTMELLQVTSLNQCEPIDDHGDRDRVFNYLLELLPHSLSALLREKVWENLGNKTLQWLLSIRRSPICKANEHLFCLIQDTVIALSHFPPYKEIAVWSEAVSDVKYSTATS